LPKGFGKVVGVFDGTGKAQGGVTVRMLAPMLHRIPYDFFTLHLGFRLRRYKVAGNLADAGHVGQVGGGKIAEQKTITVAEARRELSNARCDTHTAHEETTEQLIAAVRREADERWEKAIENEINYHRYARSAIGESAVVVLANVLKKAKEQTK